jgi:branched-chain amino acid transport system permease protein
MDSWLYYFPQLLSSGVTLGAIYALVGLGFVTISRASQIINFAQGEFVMLGGVITFFLLNGVKLPYFFAALIAVMIVILIGFMMHVLVIYPLRKTSILILMMATLGASIFLSSTNGLIFGTLPKTLPPFSGEHPLQIGEISILPQNLWVLLSTFILLIFLYLLSHRTSLGKAMEASSTDPLGADLLGISRNLMVFLAFGVSAGVGAIAGILITPLSFTSYSSGTLLGLKGFIAAVLGGWGKNSGAILGGFVLGIVESLSLVFIPSGYKDAVAFVILLLILSFRPKGILGSPYIDSRRW